MNDKCQLVATSDIFEKLIDVFLIGYEAGVREAIVRSVAETLGRQFGRDVVDIQRDAIVALTEDEKYIWKRAILKETQGLDSFPEHEGPVYARKFYDVALKLYSLAEKIAEKEVLN